MKKLTHERKWGLEKENGVKERDGEESERGNSHGWEEEKKRKGRDK